MKRARKASTWSLGAVARSYRTVVILAALIALWVFAAYEWLGLAESSGLLLILALVWAMVQLLVILRDGWRKAMARSLKLFLRCAFGTPFLTTSLSLFVFGGSAYKLANWHPIVTPGFWDYTQMIVRIALTVLLLSAGVSFAFLSLARLHSPQQEVPSA